MVEKVDSLNISTALSTDFFALSGFFRSILIEPAASIAQPNTGILNNSFFARNTILQGRQAMLNNISKKIGTSYSEYTSGAVGKLSFGKARATTDLSDGSVFYLHAKSGSAGGWTVLGLIGRVSKRYSIYGFKVKDGNIEDVAYGAFLPDYQGWKLGFLTIYNDEGMIDEIKDRYGEFLKTSKGQNVSSWN